MKQFNIFDEQVYSNDLKNCLCKTAGNWCAHLGYLSCAHSPIVLPSNSPNYSSIFVPGLKYITEYITVKLENQLIGLIDEMPWITELKRRIQHYGYRYNYKKQEYRPTRLFGRDS
jgi:hypothetical protein